MPHAVRDVGTRRPVSTSLRRAAARLGIAVTFGTLATAVAGRPAQAQFGTNLITNAGAEAGAGGAGSGGVPIPGWTTSGDFAVIAYSTGGGYPDPTSPGPADRGLNFFGGGIGASSSATQVLDLSSFAGLGALIDGGTVRYDLAAWLGGFDGQGDNMTFTADFLDGAAATVGSVTIGPVTTSDRGGITGFLLRNAGGGIPVGTRSVAFTMLSTRLEGSANDGYADNLSFMLARVSGPSVVPEPGTWALLGTGLLALGAGARRRARATG